ncbi:SdpI family protein [Lactiplantibacillus daowaiensis]|uniref:SdpI family protein n=1 Tax=Lactiplantibacillus daowaiensis TaxID=2559918 RepID=A0ABW1S364_9LACO|nr:SdpI family protein [Lactiplantibacillus daowaiensis]
MHANSFGLAWGFLIFLLVWVYQWYRMPKFRSLLGYTSRRAIQDEQTWQFAQHFYAMLGVEIFTLLLIAAIIGGLFKITWLQSMNVQAIGLGVGLILQNLATERELKHAFPGQPTPKP